MSSRQLPELSHHPQNLRYEVGLHDQHIGDAVHGDNRVANGSASRLYASQRTKMRARHRVQRPHVLTVDDEILDVRWTSGKASMNAVMKRL